MVTSTRSCKQFNADKIISESADQLVMSTGKGGETHKMQEGGLGEDRVDGAVTGG